MNTSFWQLLFYLELHKYVCIIVPLQNSFPTRDTMYRYFPPPTSISTALGCMQTFQINYLHKGLVSRHIDIMWTLTIHVPQSLAWKWHLAYHLKIISVPVPFVVDQQQCSTAVPNSTGTWNVSRPNTQKQKLCISLHCAALQRAEDMYFSSVSVYFCSF